MCVLVIFQSKAAVLGVFLGRGPFDSPSAEMLYPGDVWRIALRLPPPFIE